jgi:hypothetical protein
MKKLTDAERLLSLSWEDTIKDVLGLDVYIRVVKEKVAHTMVENANSKYVVMTIGAGENGNPSELFQSYLFFHELGHLMLNSPAHIEMVTKKFPIPRNTAMEFINVVDDLMIDYFWSQYFPRYFEITKRILSDYVKRVFQEFTGRKKFKLTKKNFWLYVLSAGACHATSIKFKHIVSVYNEIIGNANSLFALASVSSGDTKFYSSNSSRTVASFLEDNKDPEMNKEYERVLQNLYDIWVKLPDEKSPAKKKIKVPADGDGEGGSNSGNSGNSGNSRRAGTGDGKKENVELKENEQLINLSGLKEELDNHDLATFLSQKTSKIVEPYMVSVLKLNKFGFSFAPSIRMALEGERKGNGIGMSKILLVSGTKLDAKRTISYVVSKRNPAIFRHRVSVDYHGSKWLFVVDVSSSTINSAVETSVLSIEIDTVSSFIKMLPTDVITELMTFSTYHTVLGKVKSGELFQKIRNSRDLNGGTAWYDKFVSELDEYAKNGYQVVILTDGEISIDSTVGMKFFEFYKKYKFKPIILLYSARESKPSERTDEFYALNGHLKNSAKLVRGKDYGVIHVSNTDTKLEPETFEYLRRILSDTQ